MLVKWNEAATGKSNASIECGQLCDLHFNTEDIIKDNKGRVRLRTGTVPIPIDLPETTV